MYVVANVRPCPGISAAQARKKDNTSEKWHYPAFGSVGLLSGAIFFALFGASIVCVLSSSDVAFFAPFVSGVVRPV